MSISILGGVAKGANLATPNSNLTRPTSVLLKRRFFDSHQSFEDVEFYDICAGSGSIGLEALSRGASKAVFVELNAKALALAKQNYQTIVTKYPVEGSGEFIKGDCVKYLEKLEVPSEQRVLFFDPPYENQSLYTGLADLLKKRPELFTKVVIEFCRQKTASESLVQQWFGKPDKSYRQGTSFLYIYDLT